MITHVLADDMQVAPVRWFMSLRSEAKGEQHATLWRLTFPAHASILMKWGSEASCNDMSPDVRWLSPCMLLYSWSDEVRGAMERNTWAWWGLCKLYCLHQMA